MGNDLRKCAWEKPLATLAAVVVACCFMGAAFHAAELPAQTSEASKTTGDVEEQRTSPDTVLRCPTGTAEFRDQTFHSKVFGAPRHYRIFLPANYDAASTRYPVIYYLHEFLRCTG